MLEIAGSCLSHGTIIGGVFHPTRQLAGFSPPNMPYILNLIRISLRGEAVNYRPFASSSFEVASHVKNCHFGDYYYYIMYWKGALVQRCNLVSAKTCMSKVGEQIDDTFYIITNLMFHTYILSENFPVFFVTPIHK